MLSYVYFGTNDLERAITFYNATLTTLGMKRCITGDPDWDRVAADLGAAAGAFRRPSRPDSAAEPSSTTTDKAA